ncbi:MAG TPA: hypothetical protein DCX06_00095 [Opitutae bacterium]|nr:hypothetical protein [Opitutae bacterium]
MPTLAKIGGAVIPSDRTVDGLDLLPVWTGNATYPDRSFFVNESGSNNTLIKGNWKIRNNELYDLSADIQEQTNVSGVPANSATLAAMQSERSALITSFNNDNEPRGEFTNFEILLSTNDIDVPEGGTGEAQIRLSAAPGATVTVTVSHFSGDSDLSVSGGSSLVFSNSNWSDWQTVTFAAANDADATSDGATFRAELSTDNNVRELFVFEDDDEAPADVASSLVWPKTLPVVTADSTTKIVGQGRSSLDGQIDQAGSVYAWAKVSGPGAVTFSSPNDKVTGVSFSTDGVYVVRFYADHPSAGSGDSIDFTVYVNVAPENDSTAKFSPQLIYEAESDGDGDATWENTLSPGSMDISLSSGVTRSVAIPGTPVTLVDFGMDGDINGGSAGAEASGISGNGGGVSWALGTPTTLDSNLSIVSGVQSIGIQNGSGISVPAGSGQQTNDYSYIGHDSTTLAGAISGNDYIFVRLTIASGYELYVDGYQFDLWRNGGQAVENYAVFHGASGFSAASGSEDAAANVPGAGTGSLAFLGASGLGAVYTGTVEFRIYGWQGSGQTELGNTHFDAFSLTGIVSETAASGSDSFFSASYNFPGGQTMEGGVAESLVSYSSGNASFEIWFKPSSLPIATPQVLWEAGGDIGVALVLSGISLSFVVDDGDSNVVNGATIDGTLAPDPGQDGYVHAVGVIDLDAGQTKLYLDGVLVDTGLIPNVNTWTGSSGVGVGKIDSAVAGSNGATSFELLGGNDQLSLPIEAFGGEIALIRFYDYALIAGQVSDLFADPAASELLNRSPQISAGPDQAVDFTAPLVLVGSASDDRLGSGELNINWRQVSGADPESAFPGSLTLADYSALSTSGTTNAAGSYTLYLEVDDAEVKVYDNIDIEFSPLTYAQWASTISFPVGESAPTDDPDLDKMANLEEWARGTEPLDFDAAPNSGFSLEKVGAINQYTYTFDVPRDRAPLIALQWSVNLSQWYTVTDVDPRFDVMSGSTVRWSADVAVDISLRSKFFLRGVITAE